jgi:hypothetical protein
MANWERKSEIQLLDSSEQENVVGTSYLETMAFKEDGAIPYNFAFCLLSTLNTLHLNDMYQIAGYAATSYRDQLAEGKNFLSVVLDVSQGNSSHFFSPDSKFVGEKHGESRKLMMDVWKYFIEILQPQMFLVLLSSDQMFSKFIAQYLEVAVGKSGFPVTHKVFTEVDRLKALLRTKLPPSSELPSSVSRLGQG